MKKFLLKIIICLICFPVSSGVCFAKEEQTLYLKEGYVYLLLFDSKIEDFRVGNTDCIKAELVNNIFNDKKQMIIKPLSNSNTNIIVWTQDRFYNIDILINDKQDSEKIIKLEGYDPKIKKRMKKMILDAPPVAQKDKPKLIIDEPPAIN